MSLLLTDYFIFFQLPLLCRTAGDIVEVFLIKHSLVATHYARFSFASPNFKPEVDPLETEEYPTKIGPEARNVIISVFISSLDDLGKSFIKEITANSQFKEKSQYLR